MKCILLLSLLLVGCPASPRDTRVTLYGSQGAEIRSWRTRSFMQWDGYVSLTDAETGGAVYVYGTIVVEPVPAAEQVEAAR